MNNYTWNKYKNNKQPYSTKGKRKSIHKCVTKPCKTEEKAIIRRFHDARRMARFKARKRKGLEEAKTFEIGNFNELSAISELKRKSVIFKNVDSIVTIPNITQFQSNLFIKNPSIIVHPPYRQSKYSQLLTVIQELGKDIKLMYASSKISAERIKLGIIKARMLIKECLLETKLNSQ